MFHRGWDAPPMRCQGFSRTRITRARYPEMLCFFAVTSVTHSLARSFVFHSFPSFFLRKIQPSFAVTPFFIPHNTPFCAGQSTFSAKSGTFSAKCGTFSVKSRTFSRKQRTFLGKSRTFSAKIRQEMHRPKPMSGTIFHIPSVKSITFAKKILYHLKINILPQQCDRCDSKKQ